MEGFARRLVLKQRYKVTLFCCAKHRGVSALYLKFTYDIYIERLQQKVLHQRNSKFWALLSKRILMHKSTCVFPWRLQYCVFCHLFLSFFFNDFYKILTIQKELQDLGYKICNTNFETSDQNVLVEYKGKEAMFWSNVKWI